MDALDILLLDQLVKAMEEVPLEARARTYNYLHDRFPAIPSTTDKKPELRYGPGPYGVGVYAPPLAVGKMKPSGGAQ